MRNLRYMKIYDSCCSRRCKNQDCKLYFPDGLEFPLEEVRYLHWVKFPLDELPPDFRPENLVDLRLPNSNITRVWEGEKVFLRVLCIHVFIRWLLSVYIYIYFFFFLISRWILIGYTTVEVGRSKPLE